jgi:hypothetical protein
LSHSIGKARVEDKPLLFQVRKRIPEQDAAWLQWKSQRGKSSENVLAKKSMLKTIADEGGDYYSMSHFVDRLKLRICDLDEPCESRGRMLGIINTAIHNYRRTFYDAMAEV